MQNCKTKGGFVIFEYLVSRETFKEYKTKYEATKNTARNSHSPSGKQIRKRAQRRYMHTMEMEKSRLRNYQNKLQN